MAMTNTTLDANEMMESGYFIIGLHPIVKGKCSCGNPDCKATGKHPSAANWQHPVEWSYEQLEIMQATEQFTTGYGVLVNGLLVVDVDARNGGVEAYARLLAVVPELGGAGLVVETGSGNGSRHLYFKLPSDVALVSHLADYKGIDFKSSGFVVGPGSLHASGSRYVTVAGEPIDISPAPDTLLALLRKPDKFRAEFSGGSYDLSTADLIGMLSVIDPDSEHEVWLRVGMALHHATQGTGFELWDGWSANGKKYPTPETLEKRWHSFGKSANPTTIGTLIHYATERGWVQPVTFESDAALSLVEVDDSSDSTAPFDITGVDLLRPPGLVGDMAKWINKRSRYPREKLAVAAALTAMGNVIGLRYIDKRDKVTGNLFMFCVAGSGTGKESIGQCFAEIHRAVGYQGALHGIWKSEQEVTRNLIRHQACLYSIDEFGKVLQKIENASKRGGLPYLEGILGTIMSVYSKARGYWLVSGDAKEEMRVELQEQCSAIHKKLDSGIDKNGENTIRLRSLENTLKGIDNGIQRPFLSLIGYSVPENFDQAVTSESCRNGFIGRSIIVREFETNPKLNPDFDPEVQLSMPLVMSLSQLANGMVSEVSPSRRVESYVDPHEVPTNAEAHQMLLDANQWLLDYGDEVKDSNGYEAIVRRTYELISKVSFILAAPSDLRTKEHVRWATAYCLHDMHTKIAAACSNDPNFQTRGSALRNRLIAIMDNEDGATVAWLHNNSRGFTKEDVQKMLDIMEQQHVVRKKEHIPKRGRRTMHWFKLKVTK